jgi:hypothetical protein
VAVRRTVCIRAGVGVVGITGELDEDGVFWGGFWLWEGNLDNQLGVGERVYI